MLCSNDLDSEVFSPFSLVPKEYCSCLVCSSLFTGACLFQVWLCSCMALIMNVLKHGCPHNTCVTMAVISATVVSITLVLARICYLDTALSFTMGKATSAVISMFLAIDFIVEGILLQISTALVSLEWLCLVLPEFISIALIHKGKQSQSQHS